ADPEIAVRITEKISDYILQPPAGHWKSSMLLVADDTHKAGGGDILVEISHVSHSNDIYEMMRDATEIQCLYGTDYDLFYGGGIPTLPELTADVLSAINEGVAWINYIGHGNETTLADELILDMERDLSFISPPLGKIPVWVVGSCDLGHYDNADCLTEALIAKPDGAIAMITTTRLILSQPVGAYLERLYTNLHEFSQIPSDFRLGDLVMESKSGSSDYVFQLFGDPALPIVLPQYSVITTEYPDTLRILDQNTFTTVDSLIGFSSHITVRGPDQFIHQVYEGWVNLNYQLPGIRIFSGDFSDSVPLFIPMDYPLCETCPAEILLSSDNSQEAGQTYFQSIPGVPVIPPNSVDDSSPPEIQLTYFGSEVLEDQIVEIPYTFVLTLQDSSGLNLMDLPGHQIQYQIDNQYPVDITGQFQYTQDNFGHGFVEFEIGPEFSGNHDLVLEAWDNANNRSVLNRSLCFEDCGNEGSVVDYGWSSITSVLTANDLTQSGGSLYASTSGGLLEFSMDSHDFQKILPGEALVHGNLISIYRDSHHYLWIGSANPGALQIYEPNVGLLRNIDNLNITSIS
ncbi:MAG: C25 family cysteine peptidase, partial [Fidelibacterota bacterium]